MVENSTVLSSYISLLHSLPDPESGDARRDGVAQGSCPGPRLVLQVRPLGIITRGEWSILVTRSFDFNYMMLVITLLSPLSPSLQLPGWESGGGVSTRGGARRRHQLQARGAVIIARQDEPRQTPGQAGGAGGEDILLTTTTHC